MTKDELLEKVKELLRFSIATKLKIKASDYSTSLDTKTAVQRCVTVVMAIGCNKALDSAVDDLCELFGAFSSYVDRSKFEDEVEACYNTFRLEVAAFTNMHELNQLNVVPKDIWNVVSAPLDFDESYDALYSECQ